MLALVAFALLAAGCGGGDAAVADAPPVDPAAAAAPPAGTTVGDPAGGGGVTGALTGGDEVPGANEISGADAAVGSAVKLSARTPKKFRSAHCAKPIIVVYYQPDSIVDEKLLDEARAAAATVEGSVSLIYTPKEIKAAGDLPAKLGLFATPGVATVGRDGKIENFWTTYVDRSLIQRSLRNAAASRACKVSSADVPAAGSPLEDAALVAGGGKLPTQPATDPLAAATAGAGGAVDPAAGAVDPAAGATGVDPLTGAPTS